MDWAYGVTTCLSRRKEHLPKTLESLRLAGFDSPRLFVDGANGVTCDSYSREFSLEVTGRNPVIRTYGNWVLGLAELYIRKPSAQRFAMFQDDFVTYKNLRRYLEKCKLPEKGYFNLYTVPTNQELCKVPDSWFPSAQNGRGAVALMFDKAAVLTLLTQQHMVERPMNAHRGWRAIDGGIIAAMGKAGYVEYCHSPSLVYHTGKYSSMGNDPTPQCSVFLGEEFDALNFLAAA